MYSWFNTSLASIWPMFTGGGIPCATILLGIVLLMIFITFLLHMWFIHDHKM